MHGVQSTRKLELRGIGGYRSGRSAAHHLSSGHSSEIPPRESGSGYYSRLTDTCARPLKFRARAPAGVRSRIRDLRCGPRSLIVTMIERRFRLFSTGTGAHNGNVFCAAVIEVSFGFPPNAPLNPV